MSTYSAPISNYYGTPFVQKRGDSYFLALDNWDGTQEVEISQQLYSAWKSEFANYERQVAYATYKMDT